uniref:Argininosuccinate synthase n=1 Tax=Leptospirillum sp. Group II '5-way CG' TaxID=419541 RepID=B6AKF7_9BACT|nr:MAG: Argininosuccinate synthase [Leptospirillum sp. Group II '5-way CG']
MVQGTGTGPGKVVLAYSGGLDTSVIMTWLKEKYGCQVVAYCADLGQGEDLEEISRKAFRTGASKVYVRDLREEFVKDFLFPMIQSGAVYEDGYLLGTSIARPLIAKAQMEIARLEGADAVAHGATGKGNDQVRFEMAYAYFDPRIQVIAPWREWEMSSRSELINYAKKHAIPIQATLEKPYSIDRNLFHTSYEGGILEDPWIAPPKEIFTLTKDPVEYPDIPAEVTVSFEKGIPIAINGDLLDPVPLLERANQLGGEYGIGRIDLVESRFVGMKSRGVYETPGGTLLYAAHRALETLTLDREILKLKQSLVPQFASLIYNGFWYSPEREALWAMILKTQERVTGDVRLQLYKGALRVLGRRSPYSLYRKDLATFEAGGFYNQADATGFIHIQSLRLKLYSDQVGGGEF